ncbi:hypothetical protein [Streptomyces abyssalis]|uniref:hypothetical protein n=1 Tax=Streptomyces abyssalis TaxID=933944 RepID=UPI0014956479|nr:hypothetical protein [Streptomyces abyssalis]
MTRGLARLRRKARDVLLKLVASDAPQAAQLDLLQAVQQFLRLLEGPSRPRAELVGTQVFTGPVSQFVDPLHLLCPDLDPRIGGRALGAYG